MTRKTKFTLLAPVLFSFPLLLSACSWPPRNQEVTNNPPPEAGEETPYPSKAEIPKEHLIDLQACQIDTRRGEPPMPADLRLDKFPPGKKGYYIVQYKSPLDSQTVLTAISALGGEMLSYVPNNAYLVRLPEERLPALKGSAPVQWVGIYQPYYRISPPLFNLEGGKSVLITVVIFQGESTSEIAKEIAKTGAKVTSSSVAESEEAIPIVANLEQVRKIALILGVQWIEEWFIPHLLETPSP